MKRDQKTQSDSYNPQAQAADLDAAEINSTCEFLLRSEITSCDLLVNGSNYVFLTTLATNGTATRAIYKPRKGEAPLWDFPDGTLYKREYASFLVSQALGWELIPPTVIREGPYGIGSVQWFVETHHGIKHYLQVTRDMTTLKQVAVFDYVVNNTDRKAGHFLVGKDARLWVVDHGLTFNEVPKLRTVLWDFSGQKVPKKLVADVKVLQEKLRQKPLRDALSPLLDKAELAALEIRIRTIIQKPVFPRPGSHRSVPWPWV